MEIQSHGALDQISTSVASCVLRQPAEEAGFMGMFQLPKECRARLTGVPVQDALTPVAFSCILPKYWLGYGWVELAIAQGVALRFLHSGYGFSRS